MIKNFTSVGFLMLLVLFLRSVIGFREDYLYFKKYKKEKFTLVTYYRYLRKKVKKDPDQVKD